jgi:hypothetical protein
MCSSLSVSKAASGIPPALWSNWENAKKYSGQGFDYEDGS